MNTNLSENSSLHKQTNQTPKQTTIEVKQPAKWNAKTYKIPCSKSQRNYRVSLGLG